MDNRETIAVPGWPKPPAMPYATLQQGPLVDASADLPVAPSGEQEDLLRELQQETRLAALEQQIARLLQLIEQQEARLLRLERVAQKMTEIKQGQDRFVTPPAPPTVDNTWAQAQ